MDAGLPEVVLTVAASVDGRITLGRHQRLFEPSVSQRWASISEPGVFLGRSDEIGATVVLEGSGSFVDVDAEARRRGQHPPPPTPNFGEITCREPR